MHFLLTIAYCGRVIVAQPCGKITGEYFVNFVAGHLPHAVLTSHMSSQRSQIQKFLVVDNDPCQNNKVP